MPKRSTEAKNLDEDEQKIYENLTQLNKVTKTCQDAKEHCQQQARRAQPTAGEKSVPNSREKSKEPKEHSQQQAVKSTANSRQKRTRRTMSREKEVGPMMRVKDSESHQHIATEQEWKDAEKARERRVEQHRTDDVRKGVTHKQQEVQQTVADR